jgi:glycosyltransferase involved in cell wall biosynthesis
LKPSLSVLVPLRNAQATIGSLVTQLVDVSPDLAPRFEILILDQASTDDTGEIGHELSLAYPQVSSLTLPAGFGRFDAVRLGLSQTCGDLVLVREPGSTADLFDLHKLWPAAGSHDVVVARGRAERSAQGIPYPLSARSADRGAALEAGLQLYWRRVTHGWMSIGGSESLLSHVLRKGYRAAEVLVRCRAEASSRPEVEKTAPLDRTPRFMPVPRPASKSPPRPNYLARLKAFAWGE